MLIQECGITNHKYNDMEQEYLKIEDAQKLAEVINDQSTKHKALLKEVEEKCDKSQFDALFNYVHSSQMDNNRMIRIFNNSLDSLHNASMYQSIALILLAISFIVHLLV